MVVNPKDLLERITAVEEQVLAKLERKIDDALTARFDGSNEVYVYVTNLWAALRPPVQAQLSKKYSDAGWCVRLESDQREGPYLKFSYTRD